MIVKLQKIKKTLETQLLYKAYTKVNSFYASFVDVVCTKEIQQRILAVVGATVWDAMDSGVLMTINCVLILPSYRLLPPYLLVVMALTLTWLLEFERSTLKFLSNFL